MSDADFESLRHSALGMLADGNSLESVAHVLAVPVDVLVAWRARGAPPAAPATVVVATLPAPDEPDAPQRPSFHTTLAYSASTTFRLASLALTCALGASGAWAVQALLRTPPSLAADPADLVYQVALDGRVVLACDEVKKRQHDSVFMPALLDALLALGFFVFMVFAVAVGWKRSAPQPADG